jgi:leucyl-tRNA synthetase
LFYNVKNMPKYDYQKIETKWQKKWLDEKIYEPDLWNSKNPFFNLMMFPYPSAEGLHVGNMYAFAGSDIYGRFKRMHGYDVFEPIGLDGFGIHSENYALKIGVHPADQVKIAEKRFYNQLNSIGNGFAWNERLETYDPEYYKWTQWLFVRLWKAGLAYRKTQAVNWCPSCKTVLSDEQVEGGKCERCDSVVEKKELEQWFLKITDYADRLLSDLENLDWSNKIKIAQTNWIGKSVGAEINFNIVSNNENKKDIEPITVFTTRPDTLFGATYLVLAPENKFVIDNEDLIKNVEEVKKYVNATKNKTVQERIKNAKNSEGSLEKTGVELIGVNAINSANGEKISIWIADYVLSSYGTGAIMAVPAHDERDFDFAKKYNIPIKYVISPKEKDCKIDKKKPFIEEGVLINSENFSGLNSSEAKSKITKFVNGKEKTQFHLRDWLISRQRYWGPPIPMIFCENCMKLGKGDHKDMPGWFSVKEEDLPVKLPYLKNFRPMGSGESPLAQDEDFYKVICPSCGGVARRETDVSDTFLDSAWYYLRYLDVNDEKEPFKREINKKWLPVNMYIGGAEHAVLHLLYVRFIAMALYDQKLIDFDEPFKKFRANGLVIKDGAKMSKSKGNVINPDEYIKNFGADTLRMYLMFLAPFSEGGDFRDSGVLGTERFLDRVYVMAKKIKKENIKTGESKSNKLKFLINKTIKKVTEDIEDLHYNTSISALMILLRAFEENENNSIEDFKIFTQLLAPFAPYLSEEIWREIFEMDFSIHISKWPSFDEKMMQEDSYMFIVQVNGKKRDSILIDSSLNEEQVKDFVLNNEKIKNILAGEKPKKIIYVHKKIINIVI